MIRLLNMQKVLICVFVAFTLLLPEFAKAQIGKSTGRFNREGVIAAITDGNITLRHDDGEEVDYSTSNLLHDDGKSISVKGKLPTSFIDLGMLLSTTVRLSPMGKAEEAASEFRFVNDQSTPTSLDRTDTPGVYNIVGLVIRRTGQGLLLKVPKSPLARQGRVELTTTSDTKLTLEMHTLDHVNPGDTVESMLGITYEDDLKMISSISIELSPHRKRSIAPLSKTDQLLRKYAYLSDVAEPQPREVKLSSFVLHTDISELQAKVLGTKLEEMYDAVRRYYKKRPKEKVCCKIVANEASWVTQPLAAIDPLAPQRPGPLRTNSRSTNGSQPMMPKFECDDDHDTVLRKAFESYCKSTYGSTGPKWYADGMALVANYWETNNRAVSVPPEFVAFIKSAPPRTLPLLILDASASENTNSNSVSSSSSSFGSDALSKNDAACWALCYMMIHNGNYKKDFRSLGIDMLMGQPETFRLRFGEQLRQVDFEYRQFVKNFDIGYREDLCEWNWRTTPKKLFGSDMITTDIDSRAGWQATKVQVVKGETYEYVAKGEWLTDPEFEPATASGLNGSGRLLGTIFHSHRLSETIRMSERGKFTAESDGQLFLRCEDKWNELDDNKGRMKVYVRKSQ